MTKNKQSTTYIIIVGGLLAIALFLGVQQIMDGQEKLKSVKAQAAQVLMSEQDRLIQSQTETAISMLEELNNKVTKKELTLARAKVLGADILRQMRYGKDGYFFADTSKGVNVVLYGRRDVEGKNRLEDNIKGVSYVKEIISKGTSGGGFTDYWYSKLDKQEPMAKRAYSKYFEAFDWVVGTGYYVDDVKAEIVSKGF